MFAGECLYHTARDKAAKQYKLALKLSPEVPPLCCVPCLLAPVFGHPANSPLVGSPALVTPIQPSSDTHL